MTMPPREPNERSHAEHVVERRRSWLRSRAAVVLLAFLAIAGFFLVTEHTAHVFGALPYALLLACPLLHVFMHGGHQNHGQRRDGEDSR